MEGNSMVSSAVTNVILQLLFNVILVVFLYDHSHEYY